MIFVIRWVYDGKNQAISLQIEIDFFLNLRVFMIVFRTEAGIVRILSLNYEQK